MWKLYKKDPLNHNNGFKTVSDKLYSLDKILSVLRHQIGIAKSIGVKKQILDILDKVEVTKEFRNDVVHVITGTHVKSNELAVLPFTVYWYWHAQKSTIVPDGL